MAAKKCRAHRYWGCAICPDEAGKTPLVRFPTLDNMSFDEYLRFAKEDNIGCPVCRSRDVIHEFTNQPSDNLIEQDVFCRECECHWKEEFKMVTYSNVKYPRGEES